MLALPALALLAAAPIQGSMVAVDPLGRGTWVVDADRDEVVLQPEQRRAEATRISVGRWPQHLVVDAAGRVFVACRQDGRVDVIGPGLTVAASVDVGPEPRALVLDGTRLYAGLVTAKAIAVIDTATLKRVRTLPLDVEPTTLALTPDGLAVLPRKAGAVTFVAPDTGKTRVVPLTEDGRQAWHGLALVPVGDALVVLHASVDTGLTTPVPSGGYGGSVAQPIVAVASVIRGGVEVRPPQLAMGRTVGVADVSGAVYDRGFLFLTGRGDGRVFAARFDASTLALSPGFSIDEGVGLTGLAVAANGDLHVGAAFGEKRVVLRPSKQLQRLKAPDLTAWTLGQRLDRSEVQVAFVQRSGQRLSAAALPRKVAEGRALFHTATSPGVSGQSGLSCATCHPDGREDGLVWRLRGTRRQTPFLAHRLDGTAPFNWEGSARDLPANIRQTVTRLGGDGLSAGQTQALADYLTRGLRAPTLPAVEDPALVARGAALFRDDAVGCPACHSDAVTTDGARHDVQSVTLREQQELRAVQPAAKVPVFDTPSLRYLGLTAPYLHDGQAATLDALLEHNGEKMGDTRALSGDDRRALAAYLATL